MTDTEQYPSGVDYARQAPWDENKVFLSYHRDLSEANQLLHILNKRWEAVLEPIDTDFFQPESWIVPMRFEKQLTLALRFNALVHRWKKETGHYSVVARRYQHDGYKKIIEMKSDAIPLILEELRRNPDRWFSALVELSGENPAEHAKTFYEAVDKWVAWGVQHKHLRDATLKPSP